MKIGVGGPIFAAAVHFVCCWVLFVDEAGRGKGKEEKARRTMRAGKTCASRCLMSSAARF